MSSAILSVILEGKNKTSQAVNEAKGGLEGLRTAVGNFGRDAMGLGLKVSAGITTPLALMGLKAVSAASDLQESMSKVGIVFGENAAQVTAWSTTATTAFGMTQQQALESAGTFGNLFSAMGIGQDASTDMSMGLVQLASDLASFNNIDPTEALEKLRAGLVGEAEPLRTLGVNLTAAATEARAMAMGLAASTDELTPAMLAQARYALIMEQTALAQGDFARTSEGLANQTRIVKAQLGDLAAQIGTALLPFVTQAVQFISGLVTKFMEMDAPVRNAILVIAGLAAAAGPVVMVLGAVATGLGALLSPVGLVVAAIAALAAAWATDFGGIRTTVTEFWNTHLKPIFDTLVAWLQENIPVALQTLANFWENVLKPAIETVWEFLEQYIFPVIETLVNVYIALAKAELEALALIWENVLKPAIEVVWDFLQTYVMPVLEALVNVHIAALKLALTALAGLWQNVLWPAIQEVWQIIVSNVQPALVGLKAVMDGPVGTALRTIANLFDRVAGAVAAVGSAVQGVIGWLNSLAAALGSIQLPSWLTPGSPTPWEIGLRGIEDALALVVGAVGQFGSALSKLGPEVDAIQKIASALLALVNAFVAVAGYNPQQIGPNLNILLDQLRGVIYKLANLSQLISDKALGYATTLAEAGGKITGQLKSMVDGFTAVAGYQAERIGPTLNILFDQLRGVIFKMQNVAGLVNMAGLPAAQALAEAGGKITSQLKTMVDGLTAVAGYQPQQIGPALNVLFEQLREVVRLMIEASQKFDAELVASAAVMAQAAGRITGPLAGIIDALNAVAVYGQARGGGFAARIAHLMTDLQAVASGIIYGLRGFGRDVLAGLEEAGPITEALGRLVTFIKGTAEALNALAGYGQAVQARRGNFAALIGQLMTDLQVVARGIVFGLRAFSREVLASLDETATITDALGRLVAFIQGTIDALRALATYEGVADIGLRVRAFVTDIVTVAHALRVGLGELSAPLRAAFDGAIEFGERIGRIVAVVRPGIDAIAAVTGYQAAENLPAAVRAFGRDVVAMASELRLAFGSLSEPLTAAFDGAIEFADRIARIVSVVQPGIAAITAVLGYKAAQGLAGKVRAFAADVLQVAEELRIGLGTPSEEMLAAYDAAATWATKITGILALIQPAMAALQELSRYGGGAATALHAGMEKLTRNVASLINFLSSHYQILGGEAVAQAQTFAESIVAIVSAIRRGLEEAAGIEGLNATYDGAFVVGQNWITGIVDGITSRLSDLTDLMAYIRGLFPSSPAQYGPWRDLPMGNEVTQRWLAGMSQELRRTSELERSLAGVRGM